MIWGRYVGSAALVALVASLPAEASTAPIDAASSIVLVREPYLQQGTETSMTVVWRTDVATDSQVRYGTTQGVLDQFAVTAQNGFNHIVTITGLAPGTRYYYDVGGTAGPYAGGTPEHYFETSPVAGEPTAFRVWVVGDSGLGNLPQAQVRDAMLAASGANRPELFLHMGDIAYSTGTETEFTAYHFTPYKDILRHTVMWPTLGNHEGHSTTSGGPGPSSGPYYDAFVLPIGGEAGGEPSGTEAYYSFDYAHVHFVCLNSYQIERSTTGAMATWLEADLANNVKPWVVAFWHHPPYTHGTHNSDFETEHIEMRENLLPILEDSGVDLVLGGHSHSYERSIFLDGTYSTPTPARATLVAQGNVLDGGDGRPSGTGAYRKNPGTNPHDGAVFVVAGHGGAPVGGSLDHPVMYVSEAVNGSVLLDFSEDTLSLTNIRGTGVVSDTFTLIKRRAHPIVEASIPSGGATVGILSSIDVTFSGPVSGVAAADLTVNGAPAVSVTTQAPNRYVFFLSAPPLPGIASVVLAPGGIADAANASLTFAGDSWTCTVRPRPLINEFLASNDAVIADEFGDFDAYIEIFNPSATPIDLGGMHLTHDLALPAQFTIPAGVVLPPHGHLLFWADAETSEGPTHANFLLPPTGGQVGIFDADLTPLDTLTYGAQTTDVPSGRFPDGAPRFVSMPPSPAAANTIACSGDAECAPLSTGCAAGVCVLGICTTGPAADGTPCDDGNPCTVADTCFGGSCTGAIPVPADVTNLRWEADKATIAWDGTAGPGGRYDLARGGRAELPVGAGSPECLASGISTLTASESLMPIVDEYFWYLVRGSTVCFPGTWGYQRGDGAQPTERHLSACP